MCNILSMLIIILLYSAKFWWEKCHPSRDLWKFICQAFPYTHIFSHQNFAPYSNRYSTCVVWSESICLNLIKLGPSIWYINLLVVCSIRVFCSMYHLHMCVHVPSIFYICDSSGILINYLYSERMMEFRWSWYECHWPRPSWRAYVVSYWSTAKLLW